MITFTGDLKNWKSMFTKRQPYYDDQPDGYKVSDKEFVEDNFELCVKILEELEKSL